LCHQGIHDRIIGFQFFARKACKPVILGARPRCRRRQQEGFLMCENTGTGPALDVMAFTLSHSTNARNALNLYGAANGKTGKTVEDVILPGIIEPSEDGKSAFFGYHVGRTAVSVYAHSEMLDEKMLEKARAFRPRIVIDTMERFGDLEWPVDIQQFEAPMRIELMEEGRRLLSKAESNDISEEDLKALTMIKDMNPVYSYRMPTEEEADEIPEREGATVVTVRCRELPNKPLRFLKPETAPTPGAGTSSI